MKKDSITITFINEEKTSVIHPHENILQAALKKGIEIRHKCGGKGSCTTCKIKVRLPKEHALEHPSFLLQGDSISLPSLVERRFLGEEQLKSGYRLACQTKVMKEIAVDTIEDPLKALIRGQLEALREEEKDSF